MTFAFISSFSSAPFTSSTLDHAKQICSFLPSAAPTFSSRPYFNNNNNNNKNRSSGLIMSGTNFEDLAAQLSKEMGIPNAAPTSGAAATPVPTQPQGSIGKGKGGLETVTLVHEPSRQEVTVYTYGATVTSWKVGGDDNFWVSDEAKFDMSKPIRGGIPLCWPQFGNLGNLPQHGFARNTQWRIKAVETLPDGSSSAVFTIDHLIAPWDDYKYQVEYAVTLSLAGLETSLLVRNTGDKPFSFTLAFHNYFAATNCTNLRIYGFDNLQYEDRIAKQKNLIQPDDGGAGLAIDAETDRIYANPPEEIAMFDMSALKIYKIKKTPTLPDVTLWNPFGSDGCDPGWKKFICVEPATINQPVTLPPGEEWAGAQLLASE